MNSLACAEHIYMMHIKLNIMIIYPRAGVAWMALWATEAMMEGLVV